MGILAPYLRWKVLDLRAEPSISTFRKVFFVCYNPAMSVRPTTKKLLIVGLVTSFVGYVSLLSQFCIENCSTSIITHTITVIGFGLLIIGLPLSAFSMVLAIYQSRLPKKIFWGGLIALCIIVPTVSVAVKHKNTSYNQRVEMCFKTLKPSDDPLKCNKIK